MVSFGARLYLLSLLSLLLFGSMIITPAVGSPTADPPADTESILHALRFQGLTATADALDNVIWNRAFMVLVNTTLFIPMNDAMVSLAVSLNVTELIDLLSYHIVTENLPVGRFTQLPVGTMLKTMVENTSLVVTENSKTMMTINNREVMPKDLCTISTVACYAVKEVLLLESREKSFSVSVATPGKAPILPPIGLPLPPLGVPMVPLVDSPWGALVPVGAPIVSPPQESPVMVPVPANGPAIMILPPPGSSGSPLPGSPRGAPLSPSEALEGAPSTAMTTTASMATLVAMVMLTILVL